MICSVSLLGRCFQNNTLTPQKEEEEEKLKKNNKKKKTKKQKKKQIRTHMRGHYYNRAILW